MKIFEAPEFELVKFNVVDVITESSDEGDEPPPDLGVNNLPVG